MRAPAASPGNELSHDLMDEGAKMRMTGGLPLADVGSSVGEWVPPPVPGIDFMGFLYPGDKRWTGMLEKTPHDFYHLPGYVALAARHEAAHPRVFYAESGDSAMLVPLLVRRLPQHLSAPDHWCDLTSPCGYPSPLFYPGARKFFPGRFLEALEAAAHGIEAVCGFSACIRCFPFPWNLSSAREGWFTMARQSSSTCR